MLYLVAQSCLTLCDPMDCSLPGSSVHGGSPGKNTGVGSHALHLANLGIELGSPSLQVDSLPADLPGKPNLDFSSMLFAGKQELQWRRQWHPTPEFMPGKSHGWRSLVGCSPWGRKESDTTEQLPFHFSLSCIGEGNGNPLQCSCLENPRDGGAWWAAIYGVTQGQTQLK